MDLQEWIDFGMKSGVISSSPVQEVTFEEMYRKWFVMKLNIVKPSTCDRYECTWNKFYKDTWLSDLYVSQIDEVQLIRFFTGIIIGHGITLRDFGRIYQIANNVMVYAWDLRLGGSHLLDWERIKRYLPEDQFVPDLEVDYAVPKSDVEKLLQLVVDRDIYPLKRGACLCLLLNFYLGLRVGELAALSWADIDLKEKVVRIRHMESKFYDRDETGARDGAMVYRVVEYTKTISSIRVIPLLPEAVYILQKIREYHDSKGFHNERLAFDGRSTILTRSLDRTLRKLCRKAEINYFNTHKIRKTFGTMLHMSGMPTRLISDLMGHSDIRITEQSYFLNYRDNYSMLLGYMHKGLNFEL